MTSRELAHVLAALRHWQNSGLPYQPQLEDHAPLNENEIDDLCERLNVSDAPRDSQGLASVITAIIADDSEYPLAIDKYEAIVKACDGTPRPDPTTKEKPTCRDCGSDDVTCSGELSWNVDTQDWEVENAYDGYTCSACGEENKYAEWVSA